MVEHKISYIQSEALPVLDKLFKDKANEGSFDFAFVDADKVNYLNYHERLLKLVKVGGLILYDNTLWGDTVVALEDEVPDVIRSHWRSILEFNDVVAVNLRLELSLTSIGDGLTICRRIA